MDEIKFVIKTFCVTALVVFFLQFKVGEKSADAHINDFLQGSRLISWIRDMGNGAVRMTASTYNTVKERDLSKIKLPEMPTLPKMDSAKSKQSDVVESAAREIRNAEEVMKKQMKELEEIEK